jgi:hypothetical protein
MTQTSPELIDRSCTLPTAERPMRAAEFEGLFAERLIDKERVSPVRLRLRLRGGPGVAGRTRDLAARETACCSFFEFTVDDRVADVVVLDVAVPPSHAPVLDALAALAERAGA